jgi:hypothetical protein
MKKNTFLKISKHIFHLLPVVFLGIAGFLYPGWITDGYLYDWYPRIGAFVAIYGGFIASLIWYIQNKKNL